MATKKKQKTKKTLTTNNSVEATPVQSKAFAPNFAFILKLIVVILIGASIFLIIRRYRGQFIAATINKQVITRFELNNALSKRYGQAILDEMIADRLLRQEAQKQGVSVSADETKKELDDLNNRLGGQEALDQALEQYGLTMDDLKSQIEIRLLQKKLAEKLLKADVTDEEVKAYFEENKATVYKDKKLDDVKVEITDALKNQKLQQEFVTWFEQLKNDAQIQTYL
jgi:parvulin-like peptidyl-prolyl isomerase